MVAVSISQSRTHYRAFALFWCALGVMALTFFIKNGVAFLSPAGIERVLGWNYPQYLLDYAHFGFVKRGLVGSAIGLFPDAMRPWLMLAFASTLLIALAAIATAALAGAHRRLDSAQSDLLVALVLCSPFTLSNFAFDFGRFDQFNLILLFTSLWLIRRGHVLIVALLTGIALLTHEAYLFYGVPLLLVYPWYRLRREHADNGREGLRRRYLKTVTPTALVMAACLCVLVLFGRYEPGLHALRQALPGQASQYSDSELMVWTRPLLKNLHRTKLRWTRHGYTVFQIGVYVLILLAVAIVVLETHRVNGLPLDLLSATPAGVVPLFVLGIDYSRWLELMWTLVLAVLVIRIIEGDVRRIATRGRWNRISLALFLALPLGPIGITDYFPLFWQFL